MPITVTVDLTSIALSLCCIACSCVCAEAAETCAVTARIESKDGRPNNMTWIELVDGSGKVVLNQLVDGPVLRICDFGFGPHTLRVGTNECLPISVENLRVDLNNPLDLRVTVSPCGYRSMRTGCLAYFRLVDTEGAPIPEVRLSSANYVKEQRTDSYGRWQGLFGGVHEFTFVKPGFKPSTVGVKCEHQEEVDKEVVLTRQ
jgi:hypothetical protein